MNFLISIQKEDNYFIARCSLLEITTQGTSVEEAEANIKEAIELYIESFGVDDLPKSSSEPFWTTIEISHV